MNMRYANSLPARFLGKIPKQKHLTSGCGVLYLYEEFFGNYIREILSHDSVAFRIGM